MFEESLKSNIVGPRAPYAFKFEVYDPENVTKTSQNLTVMEIRVYDVEAPLLGDGNEVAEFWLKDRSVLKDTVGNDFAEGKFSGNLNMIEYISDSKPINFYHSFCFKILTVYLGDKRRAESSGNSMQYTIITMFSVNMILKVIISTSASLMWSLIHVLQVFRYILMINLEMPKLMDILMKYLAIVVGDFEGVQDLVPNLFTEYVVNMTDLSINVTLYSRFENNGKFSQMIF